MVVGPGDGRQVTSIASTPYHSPVRVTTPGIYVWSRSAVVYGHNRRIICIFTKRKSGPTEGIQDEDDGEEAEKVVCISFYYYYYFHIHVPCTILYGARTYTHYNNITVHIITIYIQRLGIRITIRPKRRCYVVVLHNALAAVRYYTADRFVSSGPERRTAIVVWTVTVATRGPTDARSAVWCCPGTYRCIRTRNIVLRATGYGRGECKTFGSLHTEIGTFHNEKSSFTIILYIIYTSKTKKTFYFQQYFKNEEDFIWNRNYTTAISNQWTNEFSVRGELDAMKSPSLDTWPSVWVWI